MVALNVTGHVMKRQCILVMVIMVFACAKCHSDAPVYYVSPGIQLLYNHGQGLAFGFKVSVGALSPYLLVNVTAGICGGRRSDGYLEVQAIPVKYAIEHTGLILFGGGAGLSYTSVRQRNFGPLPRLSVFAGDLLFLNAIYTFLAPQDISPVQFGSTLVFPIPLVGSGIYPGGGLMPPE